MRARFYIEKRNDANGHLISMDCPVFMSITFGGKRIISGTGVKVDMNGWDPDQQRVQPSYPGYQGFNQTLDSLQKIAFKSMDALIHSGKEINSGNFHQLFQQLKPRYSSGFMDLFFQFMESNSAHWSTATYRKVRSLYNLLRAFRDRSGYPIAFHNMDSLFLERFVAFCSERGYKPSTTYKTVNNLVWFLNWSADKGYNVYREYRQFYKQMEVPEVKSSMLLFLRWDELMRLMEYRTDIRRIERARDLFCFMCFAGLRFSELQNLKKEDLRPGEIVVRKPGGGLRVVPMNRFALQIRQKYENKFYLKKSAFPSMSIITMNKYLRIGGMESGLDRKVPPALEGKPGLPLYSRLTAGIAVNTFISNALEMDVPAATIAGFTGVQNDSRVRKMRSDLAMEEMQKFNALPAGTPQKSYPSI